MAPPIHPATDPRRAQLPVSLARMPGDVWIRAIRPAYLSERDLPWLSALLEERERFVGRKRGEWKLRVDDGLPLRAPRQKLTVALRVLDRLSQDQAPSAPSPKVTRAALFREATRTPSRAAAIEAAAAKLGLVEQVMMDGLFADLTDERLLTPTAATSPEQLALLCNGELIAQLLARALRVRLDARGKVRAVVRHAKLMGLLAPDWDVVREPLAIEAGRSLIFPDFELRHRPTGKRWLLEIVGYWTPEYVQKKLETLRAANIERLIVCIDDERCCAEAVLDLKGHIVRFRRKVDPRSVLAIVDPAAHAALPEPKVTPARARKRALPVERPQSRIAPDGP